MYQIERVLSNQTDYIWELFEPEIKKTFPDTSDLNDFHQVGRFWSCYVCFKDGTPIGLGFVSKYGGRVASFHPCMKPVYVRRLIELSGSILTRIGQLEGLDYILVHIPKNHKIEWIVMKSGFEFCGCVPVDSGGLVQDLTIFKKKIERSDNNG